MKSEKGKSVFDDDVDAVLTGKIMRHTQKNIDGDRFGKKDPSSSETPHGKEYCMNISRNKRITMGIVALLLIAGLTAYLIFITKRFRRKK